MKVLPLPNWLNEHIEQLVIKLLTENYGDAFRGVKVMELTEFPDHFCDCPFDFGDTLAVKQGRLAEEIDNRHAEM